MPRPWVVKLAAFVKSTPPEDLEVTHILAVSPPGTPDQDWVPKIRDQDWTVISADGGRTPNRGRGGKLPQLCADFGVTLIILSPRVHNRTAFDKTRTILSVWNRIVEVATDESCRGRRYMLEPTDPNNFGVGRVTERQSPPRRQN